jgi:hypothetical protein
MKFLFYVFQIDLQRQKLLKIQYLLYFKPKNYEITSKKSQSPKAFKENKELASKNIYIKF